MIMDKETPSKSYYAFWFSYLASIGEWCCFALLSDRISNRPTRCAGAAAHASRLGSRRCTTAGTHVGASSRSAGVEDDARDGKHRVAARAVAQGGQMEDGIDGDVGDF